MYFPTILGLLLKSLYVLEFHRPCSQLAEQYNAAEVRKHHTGRRSAKHPQAPPNPSLRGLLAQYSTPWEHHVCHAAMEEMQGPRLDPCLT